MCYCQEYALRFTTATVNSSTLDAMTRCFVYFDHWLLSIFTLYEDYHIASALILTMRLWNLLSNQYESWRSVAFASWHDVVSSFGSLWYAAHYLLLIRFFTHLNRYSAFCDPTFDMSFFLVVGNNQKSRCLRKKCHQAESIIWRAWCSR